MLLPIAALTITGCEKKQKQEGPGQTENLATISLNKSSLVLTTGHAETLVATVANGSGDVTWTSSDTNIATVNASGEVTAVAKGSATISASYSGKTANCAVTVKNVNDVYTLVSVQQNENLKQFENNVLDSEDEFRGETSNILEVGDDNPVQLMPVLKLVDEDMNEAPQAAWEYDYEYEIKKFNGADYVDLEEAAGEFDAANCTFDFAESAIGGQFKLTVRPGGLSDTQKAKAENNKSIVVKVSNGYNVYSEKELAYANDVTFLDDLRQDNCPENCNQAWKDFRAANGLDVNYVAPAIFLQANMMLTKDHLPSLFFWSQNDAGVQESWIGKMKDAVDVYCHYARGYTFNGNYFHIDTSRMPLCVDNLDYDDNVSHTTLFKTALYEVNEVEEIVNVNFKNCTYYGNSPRGNNPEDAMGLIFFKIRNAFYKIWNDGANDHENNMIIQGTFDNFNVTRACISFFGEYGVNNIVIKDCEVSEGYSNGLYLWNNGNVEFINSKLSNFGGPVMITDGDGPDDGIRRTYHGFHVHADEATIFDNYVTGAEPWFVNTMGGLPASKMTDIKALNEIVKPVSGNTKTFVVGQNEEMNMIIINYGEIPYVQFQKDNADDSLGNQIGIDEVSPYAAGVETAANAGAPVLNSDNGTLGYWNGSWNPITGAGLGGDYLDVILALEAEGFPGGILNLSMVFGLLDL